jgi:3-deoxy-D-manno-octulosonic-acid transferase
VYVGGSLVPTGGHNMLEPALRGKPVLFGPHTTNFRESAELLLAAGGAEVVADGAALEAATAALLADATRARSMGERGRAAVQARQGGVQATLALVERFLLAADASSSGSR